MTREEWLSARRTGIGGSDIAAILRVSPWRTPLDVYRDKVDGTEQQVTEAMQWGLLLEDLIAREYSRRTNKKIQRINGIIRRPDAEWALASLDRVIVPDGKRALALNNELRGAEGVLECKAVNAFTASSWGREDDPDAVPAHYAAQCMWYLGVTGLPWCDVAALIGGQRLVVKRIQRDEELITAMLEKARDFWFNHVVARVPPEPATAAEADQAWPLDNGDSLEATADLLLAYSRAREARELRATADRQYDAAVEQIKLALGEHSALTLNGRPLVLWRASAERPKIDYDAVIREAAVPPDVIARHTTIQPGIRRFLLKELK